MKLTRKTTEITNRTKVKRNTTLTTVIKLVTTITSMNTMNNTATMSTRNTIMSTNMNTNMSTNMNTIMITIMITIMNSIMITQLKNQLKLHRLWVFQESSMIIRDATMSNLVKTLLERSVGQLFIIMEQKNGQTSPRPSRTLNWCESRTKISLVWIGTFTSNKQKRLSTHGLKILTNFTKRTCPQF